MSLKLKFIRIIKNISPSNFLKSNFKRIISTIESSLIERIYAMNIYHNFFKRSISRSPQFNDGDAFENISRSWSHLLSLTRDNKSLGESPCCYVEFGVYIGTSINWFSNNLKHSESTLLGLDTFKGLPDKWETADQPKHSYNAQNDVPVLDDNRVSFTKGMFHETSEYWINWLKEESQKNKNIIIHIDSDLFGSALYALLNVAQCCDNFYVIFDELLGDECRALYAFTKAIPTKISVISSGARSYNKITREITQRSVCFLINTNLKTYPENFII
tara:strand:+ start:294 stop:1115 length:822 start_codon:yes stop_codon:yes gene_type:complete